MLRKILSTEHTEDTDHRNLDGIYTEFIRSFLVATLEILEEIFFKNGRGPEIIMDPRKTRRARMVNVSRKISFELYSCCLFHRSRW